MNIEVGDLVLLRDRGVVEITEIRDREKYAYPIWYEDVITNLPNGCRFFDVLKILSKKGAKDERKKE